MLSYSRNYLNVKKTTWEHLLDVLQEKILAISIPSPYCRFCNLTSYKLTPNRLAYYHGNEQYGHTLFFHLKPYKNLIFIFGGLEHVSSTSQTTCMNISEKMKIITNFEDVTKKIHINYKSYPKLPIFSHGCKS